MMWDHGLGRLVDVDPSFLRVSLLLLAGVAVGLAVLLRRAASRDESPGWGLPVALLVLLGAGLFTYFAPGDVAGGDAHAHVARTWLYSDAFANEKSFPIWTNRWYLGYPLGLHYGVLYFASSGFLTTLLPVDVFAATKLFLWATHLVSGLLLFSYVRFTSRSEIAGVVAAVVYAFSFLHLGPLLLSGCLPLSLVFVFLPAALLAFEGWDRGRISFLPAATLLGLCLAFSLVNHLQYGFFTAIALVAYFAVRVGQGLGRRGDARRRSLRQLLFGVTALAISALLSGWFVLPALLEGDGLVLSSSNILEELLGEPSFAGLKNAADLFLWSRIMRDWSYYYVGVVPLAFALLSLLRLRRSREGGEIATLWIAGLICFGLSLLNPRFSSFWFFFVAVLAGHGGAAGYEAVGKILGKPGPLAVPQGARVTWALSGFFAIALLADLGPGLIQSPYRTVDNRRLRELEQNLEARSDVGRILDLEPGKGTLWRSLDVVDTGCSTPFGGIPQASTKVLPYTAAVACAAVKELVQQEGELSPPIRDALRLFDVDYIQVPGRDRPLELDGYPVWFSTRIERASLVDSIEGLDWYSMKKRFDRGDLESDGIVRTVVGMEVDPQDPRLGRIILHRDQADFDPESGLGRSTPDSAAAFEILAQEETHGTARVRYRSSAPGYLLLSYADSPRVRAEIDGEHAETFRSAIYLTVVPTREGEHELMLRATITPLRRVLLWMAAFGLIVLVLFCLRTRSPRRKGIG